MASSLSEEAFRTFDVKTRQPIKKLLQSNKIKLEKGKAYYQMTKGEIIQDYKKVVVMRKSDGKLITGDAVRDVLGVPKVTTLTKFELDVGEIPDFAVFVQSTSHNRVVLPKTKILYRVKEEDDEEEEEEKKTDTPTRATRRSTRASKATKAKQTSKAEPAKPKRGAKRKAAVSNEEEDDEDAEKEAPVAAKKNAPDDATASGPGGPIEVVFSFDTTGSMYACLGEVRRRIQDTITRMKRDIPGIKLAVIAHGDYCDERMYGYVTKRHALTDDVQALCGFVRDVGATGGGDFDECYELVLRQTTQFEWSEDAQKALVMIGDATPHEPNYPLNKDKIDWRKECAKLKKKGVKVYAVQALNRDCSTNFYRSLANLTDGFHLHLDQFSSIINFMLAICYREVGAEQLQQFEDEVRRRGMNRELHRLFDSLAGRGHTAFQPAAGGGATPFRAGGPREDGLVPVDPSRFQVLAVDSRVSIKDFVAANGLLVKAGRGFYEFTKPETVSAKKEVVLVDKVTGDMFAGKEACDMIGAGGAGKIRPAALDKFRVFVQSTSYNRVLLPETGFLYEVDTEC